MERVTKINMTLEAPEWALEGGFPEDLVTVMFETLGAGSIKVADWIYPADTLDGPYDIYRTPSGVNVRVLSDKKG